MRVLRFALGSLVALSLAACVSSGPSSAGTTPPSGSSEGTTTGAATSPPTKGTTPSTGTTAPPAGTTAPSTTATSTATAPATSTAPTGDAGDTLRGAYVLVFKQSGGIAGLRMETVLDSNAKTMTYGGMRNQTPETRAVTDKEIATITQLVNAVGLGSLNGKLKGAAMSDAFHYEMSVKAAGKDHVLVWDDGAKAPPGLGELQTGVIKLRDSKFRPGNPTNAPTQ